MSFQRPSECPLHISHQDNLQHTSCRRQEEKLIVSLIICQIKLFHLKEKKKDNAKRYLVVSQLLSPSQTRRGILAPEVCAAKTNPEGKKQKRELPSMPHNSFLSKQMERNFNCRTSPVIFKKKNIPAPSRSGFHSLFTLPLPFPPFPESQITRWKMTPFSKGCVLSGWEPLKFCMKLPT